MPTNEQDTLLMTNNSNPCSSSSANSTKDDSCSFADNTAQESSSGSGRSMVLQQQQQRLRRKCKRLFEKERSKVLLALPRAYKKNRFNEIGFVDAKPVLIVSLYRVPPGRMRVLWMQQYYQLSKMWITTFFLLSLK
jgi:hypothetical protein